MATLIIKELDSEIIKKLEYQAQKNGRTLEEELKYILTMVTQSSINFNSKEEENKLPSAKDSFREGWQQALEGETYPIEQLWEGIENE